MRVLLLNQFGPSSEAPTARILAELGSDLEKQGHQIVFISSDARYGKPRRGFRRIFHEALSHAWLLGRGLTCGPVDVVISLTSPACLLVTAALIAAAHRARHFHWAMDLYPDVGIALGELADGFPVRFLQWLMRRAYRKATRVVTLDEDMRDHLQEKYGVASAIIAPFPPEIDWPVNAAPAGQWLYSGNFGRAHEIEVLLQIQRRLEDREITARLILQGLGAQFLSSRTAADRLGLCRVEWRPPVALEKLGESLRESDVIIVTRKPEARGLLLPSKLMLAELSGRPILWIGDTNGKTAQRLARDGRHGVFARDDIEAMADWLQRQFAQKSAVPAAPTPTRVIRRELLVRWRGVLEENSLEIDHHSHSAA